ncbi:MAG TPA: methyltransferase domain-containing protein [Cyclobacteriaceae bacterium]|jgi:2-polyprenyl-3-methyl-5-hydroxy-6-metoxy-1,4-benzoquinol methylase|nr:methyltransferase domain-containing protein [Cyclobacteriaceae bacterium]
MAVLFSQRSKDVEIMDDLSFHDEVVFQTLRELDFINQWLGGNAVTLSAIEKVWRNIPKDQSGSIVDLGCGSGEMLRLIAKKAGLQNRNVELTGIDANPHIVGYAISHSNNFNNIKFEALNIFSNEFLSLRHDIVIATLFLHHFSDEELINFFTSLKKHARIGIIVNDIHRHPLAYYSIKWLTTLFSKSSMVKFDAPLSVLRAFKRRELQRILEKAGIKNYELKWKWAFRWQLIILCEKN